MAFDTEVTAKLVGRAAMGLWLAACGPRADCPPGDLSDVSTLIESAECNGFTAQQGAVGLSSSAGCVNAPSCFGSNHGEPYGLWRVPPAPGESPFDPDGFGATPDGLKVAFQLGPTEALVYVGRTPPAARYFSYTPYVWDRPRNASGERPIVFASLTDALNQTGIATFDGDVFDADTALIVTADRTTEARVRSWLIANGAPPDGINTLALPAADLHLGSGDAADRFTLFQRYALFEDESAGQTYLDDLPGTVLRLTEQTPRELAPLDVATRAPHGTGARESDVAIDELGTAIVAAHGEPTAALAATPLALDPAACLAQDTNCFGENSDTTYAVAGAYRGQFLSDDPSDFFVVYGVNHQVTEKASYSSVVVVNRSVKAGIASMTSDELVSSAEVYLPGHPELFAVRVARTCDGAPFCLEVPIGFPGVDLDEDFALMFRAYLEPATGVSPTFDEIATERVLHFTP